MPELLGVVVVCLQEYYANTGALARAAKVARKGRAVGVSVVEAFGKVSRNPPTLICNQQRSSMLV
jgi:hypothetical protein